MTCSKFARPSDLWSRAVPLLVLDRDAIAPWLAGETPTLSRSVNEDLRFFPVTPRMNKPAYNQPDCIEPLAGKTVSRVLNCRSARRGSFHASSTPSSGKTQMRPRSALWAMKRRIGRPYELVCRSAQLYICGHRRLLGEGSKTRLLHVRIRGCCGHGQSAPLCSLRCPGAFERFTARISFGS
jgi:hypothetical protein